MDTNATQTPELQNDELVNALKLISDLIIGPELRSLKDYISSADEARQLDVSNLEQKMESALAQIREDAMAISADLRRTKTDMETDSQKWQDEIADANSRMEKTSEELAHQIETLETTLQTNLTKLKDQFKTEVYNLTEDHNQRFIVVEGRITRCENESTARKNENNRLAQSLTSAAQSLATGPGEDAATVKDTMKQVDSILSGLDEVKPENNDMPDFDAVINKVET